MLNSQFILLNESYSRYFFYFRNEENMYQTSNYENTPQWLKPYTPSNSTLAYRTITLQIPKTQN